MRILIATDAWHPQVNGVVRTNENLCRELEQLGAQVLILEPSRYRTISCPTYAEIRLSLLTPNHVRQQVEDFKPEHIHISTEGPIGLMTRAYCLENKISFTTTYHTRFPEYILARYPLIPLSWTYAFLRRFHNAGSGMMVATQSLAGELSLRGFRNILPWTRGVNLEQFHPRSCRIFGTEKPVFLYVGRVATEKNIEAFLELDLPGRKIVVGDGPQLEKLNSRFGDVTFTGNKQGVELACHYASADVFVFPSKTDTFGIVLLEAMASGLPVAAFPVTGPKDIIQHGITGILDNDLRAAALTALTLDRHVCQHHAQNCSWAKSAKQFLSNIQITNPGVVEGGSPCTPKSEKYDDNFLLKA